MAQVTIQRYAAELGRLPPTCICCGQPAQQMVRHKFYYDPLWLIALGPVLGIFRYIWASQSINLFAPVCARHGWRLGLPTYLGYFFAFTLLLAAPLLIASSQIPALVAAAGWIWLAVFLYVLGMLALLLAVRLATPRLVDYDSGSVTFGSVSLGFKAAITGQALPGQGLRSVGPAPVFPAEAVFPAQVVPTAGAPGAYAPGFGSSPLRSPATNNGPLVALLGIGGVAAFLVIGTAVVLGMSYLSRARRNAEFRRQQANAQAFHEKARAEAEARHAQHVAQYANSSGRTANSSARNSSSNNSTTTPRPAPTTSPTSTTSRPSSTASASPTPFPSTIGSTVPSTSTLPTSSSSPPIPPAPPAAPAPPVSSTQPPATSTSTPAIPDDPFGIGPQIGPPSAESAGGLAPQRRPDLEAKAATEPIRGRFDKPDKEPGPDGREEIVFETRLRDNLFPTTSRPLTRVTDLRPGMEIWVLSKFRNWYRGNVVGIDGLQAMVHIYGWDHDSDELVPISRIRVATGVDQPADRPAAGADPFADRPAPAGAASVFDDALPPKKRTWTDSTGKFKIEAEFVKLAAGQVTLKRTDGKEIALPLDLLAPADQAIAKKLAEN